MLVTMMRKRASMRKARRGMKTAAKAVSCAVSGRKLARAQTADHVCLEADAGLEDINRRIDSKAAAFLAKAERNTQRLTGSARF